MDDDKAAFGATRCYHQKDGVRCSAPALKSDYFCYNHQLPKRTRDPKDEVAIGLPDFHDAQSLRQAIRDVMRAQLLDLISPKEAATLFYALQVAATTLNARVSLSSPSQPNTESPDKIQSP